MKIRLFCLLAPLLFSACAPPAVERQRFFWPPPPGEAKIEYIDFYLSDRDLLRGHENRLADIVLGIERPENLFRRPVGIASDGKGRVFVADPGQGRVAILDLNTGRKRFLQDTDGYEKPFSFPSDVSVDAAGQVYVTDSLARQILIFGTDERERTVVSHPLLVRPNGIGIDSTRRKIYVADTGAHQIAIFDFAGQFIDTFGVRGDAAGEFNFPMDVEVDREGNIFVLDSLNARIQVFDGDWRFLRKFGERGTAAGSFNLPKSLAISPSGYVYVTDSQANRFLIFDRQGNHLLTVGGRFVAKRGKFSPGGFDVPLGIDIDATESIWIIDSLNQAIHRFQYLSEEYSAEHPILPGQAFVPPELLNSTLGTIPIGSPVSNGGREK